MDELIFTQAAEALLTTLHRIACGILHSRTDAEDAVQQGLLNAWKARGRVNPDTFRPWLTRIVINECRNIQRYRMRVTPKADVGDGPQPFQPPDATVMDAIDTLPDALRIPFLLKYATGYRQREIAQALRLPLSTVKHRLARAKQLLRTNLTDMEVAFDDEAKD